MPIHIMGIWCFFWVFKILIIKEINKNIIDNGNSNIDQKDISCFYASEFVLYKSSVYSVTVVSGFLFFALFTGIVLTLCQVGRS